MMFCEICGKPPDFRYVTATGEPIGTPRNWTQSWAQGKGAGYHVGCMAERYDQMREALEAFCWATRADPALHPTWDILLEAGVAALATVRAKG